MEKINYYSSIFNPEETNSTGNQIEVTIEKANLADEILLEGHEEIKGCNEFLTKILNSSRINPYTEQCHGDDDKRTTAYMAGRDMIKAYTLWELEPEKKEAAEILVEIFDRHGNELHAYGYQKKSSALISLIKDLNEQDKLVHITTVNMIAWNEFLIGCQKQFEETYNKKLSYNNNRVSLEKKEAQLPVTISIVKLIDYLNGSISYHKEDSAWISLYSDIESIIKDATTISRSRRTHNKNKSVKE